MNELKTQIGNRLRKRRKALKLTQEEDSYMLDVSVKHYSEVERGIAGMSIENWIHLSEILNTSLDFLLRGISIDDKNILDTKLKQLKNQQQLEFYIQLISLIEKYKSM